MKVSAKQYAWTLYDLTVGKKEADIDSVIIKFSKELSANNQLNLLENIIEKFNIIWNERNGIVEAEIVSAEGLDDELVEKIKSFVMKKYEAKQVVLNNRVDKSLKGGIIIKVGDEVIDGSVKKKMVLLKESLRK